MLQGQATLPARGKRRWAGARILAPGLLCALSLLAATAIGPSSVSATNGPATPVLKAPSEREPMDVVADRFTNNSQSRVAVAIGNVYIVYGSYRLKADKVIYDRRAGTLKAIGNVWLREPNGNILKSKDLVLDDKFTEGFANYVQLLMTNDATITAVYVRREEGPVTTFEQVVYTRCKTCVTADGQPFWELKSDKARYVEEDHRIYHENARMEVLGVPVFWLPYLSHPDPQTKRASGFLVPRFGYSDTLGATGEIPYFINLAPNYDLTLRPRFTSKQGPLARAIWRHRTASGKYEIDASGIYQFNPNKVANPGNERLRGAIQSNGQFDLSTYWYWGWDGTVTSDDTYLKRYKIDGKDSFTSQVYLTGLKDRNYFNAAVYHYQSTIAGESSKVLPFVHPHIRSSIIFDRPVLGGELGFDSKSYTLTRRNGADATHWTPELHWRRQMISEAGLLVTPFASVRGSISSSDNVADPTVPGGRRGQEDVAQVMPKAGLDIRWPFISSGDDAQHIITPAAQIVTATNERKANRISNEDAATFTFDASNQFLADRFTGTDRFDGGTRADIGLIYEYLMNNGGFVKVSVGQSYHLAGRNSFARESGLENTFSDFVASAVYQPNSNLRFHYVGRFDSKTLDPKHQEVHAALQWENLFVEVNYASIDASPSFARVARQHHLWSQAALQLGNDFHLFGGLRYDVRNDYIVTNHVGIGYECDCATIKVTYRENRTRDRDVEPDRAVLLSVEFKTLGTARVGTSVN